MDNTFTDFMVTGLCSYLEERGLLSSFDYRNHLLEMIETLNLERAQKIEYKKRILWVPGIAEVPTGS